MKMDIQRVRNLTTGRLHTSMDDIYKDIEFLTGEEGIMTHMLPRARDAMMPILGERLKTVENSERFFDDKYDITHIGEVNLPTFTEDERKIFWENYSKLPSLLDKIGTK